MSRLTISVNATPHEIDCNPGDTLLEVLRTVLGMTGTKYGCGIGYCGACTVLVDGMAGHACCLLAATMDGREVTTVEGLDDTTVQHAFLDAGAVQCGYCTPGFVISAKALLAENPTPSEAEVRSFLTGNICRCSGFAAIVRAVVEAGHSQ